MRVRACGGASPRVNGPTRASQLRRRILEGPRLVGGLGPKLRLPCAVITLSGRARACIEMTRVFLAVRVPSLDGAPSDLIASVIFVGEDDALTCSPILASATNLLPITRPGARWPRERENSACCLRRTLSIRRPSEYTRQPIAHESRVCDKCGRGRSVDRGGMGSRPRGGWDSRMRLWKLRELPAGQDTDLERV